MVTGSRAEDLVDLACAVGAVDEEKGRLERALEVAERENQQLHRGLEGRTVIGQAQGILMERYGVDAAQAFAYLQRASSHSNRKLLLVAEELVATRELPLRGRAVDRTQDERA